jgi:hypothetical protein
LHTVNKTPKQKKNRTSQQMLPPATTPKMRHDERSIMIDLVVVVFADIIIHHPSSKTKTANGEVPALTSACTLRRLKNLASFVISEFL